MILQLKKLVWEQNDFVFLVIILMLSAGCTKRAMPMTGVLTGIDSIDIRGSKLTYDRFAPRNYELMCKDSSCWDGSFQFYVFIRDKRDVDTLINSLSTSKQIMPDYDTGEYDYIFCLYKGKRREYVYIGSSGIVYLGDRKIRYSKNIHELIIILLGENVYTTEMGVPDYWVYEVVKENHPDFPHVIPNRYER